MDTSAQSPGSNVAVSYASFQHFCNKCHITFIFPVYELTFSSGGEGVGGGMSPRHDGCKLWSRPLRTTNKLDHFSDRLYILSICIRFSSFSDRFILMLIGLQPCSPHTDIKVYLLHLYEWDNKGCDKRLCLTGWEWVLGALWQSIRWCQTVSLNIYHYLAGASTGCVGDSVRFLIHDCQVSCQSDVLKHKQVFVRVNRAVRNADTTLSAGISYTKCPGDAGVHVLSNLPEVHTPSCVTLTACWLTHLLISSLINSFIPLIKQ